MGRRNTTFNPEREPFRNDDTLQLIDDKIRGPFSFLNPTQAHFEHVAPPRPGSDSDTSNPVEKPARPSALPSEEDATSPATFEYKWTSRNNRKGRHKIVVPSTDVTAATPPVENSGKAVWQGIVRMFTSFPVWDVSYLVATVFTLGSVIWVINAFFVYLPFLVPSTDFPGETTAGSGVTAFIGATIFEIGSVLLMIEAVNENRVGCFGWALERVYQQHFSHDGEKSSTTRLVPDRDACSHHHSDKHTFVGNPPAAAPSAKQSPDDPATAPTDPDADPAATGQGKSFVWWPSWHELRTHYLHDLGFLACSFQTAGATVFWISGITALPGILNRLTTTAKLDGAFWAPQIVGGAGFVISGTLFMIEVQPRWWRPAPRVLGWHIGLWNTVGGVGFMISPIFGLFTAHWAQSQSACSTFWGSWAFLIGSMIQWYESLDKHPVEKAKDS